ncbi:hypothetical protein [Pseudothermotoga sp.]|uniref:hypothetical protein n=1 Tax=Pseudothermotoga sp. TaxID=2033661 RepID=UPI0031F650FA
MKQLSELFDFKSKPSVHMMVYCASLFVVANFLGLIASVAAVVSWAISVQRFLGITQGLGFFAGLGLLLSYLKWRGTLREIHRKLADRFPKYASLIITGDELWLLIGLSASIAGLFIMLVLPFGFLLLLVGLSLFEQQMFLSLKLFEEKEKKFFSDLNIPCSMCFTKIYDINYLIYSLVTFYGHSFIKIHENLEAFECYFRVREEILKEVKS